ncbi:hypothetical protein EYF80_028844 [Liparis tanakae]|uniref:Uncharacterized protein n=1 Tax=Liparis tanakae TaxID=230148 RepID=A0A4Z2H7Y7_9TELE|nr:hypothetical protein EYF80_028844 [Liparis tanakae]
MASPQRPGEGGTVASELRGVIEEAFRTVGEPGLHLLVTRIGRRVKVYTAWAVPSFLSSTDSTLSSGSITPLCSHLGMVVRAWWKPSFCRM